MDIISKVAIMVSYQTWGRKTKSSLISYFASNFGYNVQGLLSKHDDVICAQISVLEKNNLTRLLTDIGDPHWINFSFFLLLNLLIILPGCRIDLLWLILQGSLVLLLRIQVIVRENFHALIVITFNLEVAIWDDYAVDLFGEDHWAWNEEVSKLKLEKDHLIIDKVERTIYWLNTNLFIYFTTCGTKVAMDEVESITFKFVRMKVTNLGKRACRLYSMKSKVTRR